MNSKPVQ